MTVTSEPLRPVPLLLDKRLLQAGTQSYINWEPARSTQHMALIGGNTGSGKSTHLMLWLFKVWKYIPSARLYLVDFKGSDDFAFLRTVPDCRYYAHLDCAKGLEQFSGEIEARLEGSPDRSPLFIVFDEYASFISYMSIADKKLAAQCQMWMMNALFMSRGVGGYCFLCTQRPDQSIMPSGGARDQFGVRIWWGRFASSDAKIMMFGDMAKQIPDDYVGGVGRGIAYIDGRGMYEVVAPRIRNMEAVRQAITDLVTR